MDNRTDRLLRICRSLAHSSPRRLVGDLKWRFKAATGGSGKSFRRLSALVRRGGIAGLRDRLAYGVRVFLDPNRLHVSAERPKHAWLTSFAYTIATNPFFDLSVEELNASREITEKFPKRQESVRSATWFLTYFNHSRFGGVYTILRLMNFLSVTHGVKHRLVIFDNPEASQQELRHDIATLFPSLSRIDIVVPDRHGLRYDELPYTDIAVCTIWISAFALARFNRTGAKFYMMQDFEPLFYPAGSVSALAESTYRLGFAGIVNTPGLDKWYREYGNPSISFVPAPGRISTGRNEKPSHTDAIVRVVVYGRPSTDRNAFELIAAACRIAKARLGDRVSIVSVGEDFDAAALDLEDVLTNMGLLHNFDEIYDLYDQCDVGIAFMLSRHPSYLPFEYMAAGVVPVVNRNADTEWLLKDMENCIVVEPYPSHIADAVERLVDDRGLTARLRERGCQAVKGFEWDTEFERVWEFMTGTFAEGDIGE